MAFGQGTSSPSLANLSTLSASANVRRPVALPRTLGGTTTLSRIAEDDSPAVLADTGRSYTSGSAVPLTTSAASIIESGALPACERASFRKPPGRHYQRTDTTRFLLPQKEMGAEAKHKSVWGNITLFAAWVAYFGSALRGGNVIVRYEKGQPRNVIHPPIR